MDPKMSCMLKGLGGVIFGGLCLVTPEPVLSFFLGIFWILLILGIIGCIFIAISSHSEESFFWFVGAAALVVIAIFAMVFPNFISLVFALAVAVLAFHAGYSGIALALTRPKSKYLLIAGAIASSIVLLGLFLYYVPAMRSDLVMTVVGTVSFVFGLFAIGMAFHIKEEIAEPIPPHVLIFRTCGLPAKDPTADTVTGTPKDTGCSGQNEQSPK